MNQEEALQLRDNAKAELMALKDLETGIGYLNKVKAIETWAKAEKKDAELQNIIAEQKIRTQRILGRLIQDGREKKEIAEEGTFHGNRYIGGATDTPPKTLSQIGITAKQSSTFQSIANIPETQFEQVIAEKKKAVEDAVSELTTAGMVKFAKDLKQEELKKNAGMTTRDAGLIYKLKNKETIIVNQKTDLATIKWAEERGLFIRCDRSSEWGNPYEMGKDGDRDQVCYNYKYHYIQYKPSLLNKINELKGKALGCWCAPEKCHCETLKSLAENEE